MYNVVVLSKRIWWAIRISIQFDEFFLHFLFAKIHDFLARFKFMTLEWRLECSEWPHLSIKNYGVVSIFGKRQLHAWEKAFRIMG